MKQKNSLKTRTNKAVAGLLLGAFFAGVVAPNTVTGAQGPAWQNPLNLPAEPGSGVADPQIIRFRGFYYLYSTGGDVRVWSSTDLVTWADRGLCLVGPVNGKAWGPRVLYYNGTFYMYASGDTGGVQKQSVYTSSSPMGPFALAKTTLLACIDGLPFLNDNNQLYFYYAALGGIRYRTMPDPLTVASTSAQLTGCKVQTFNTWTEAPHVANIDGTYFMSYTGNDWTRSDYQVHMGRGSSPTNLSAQSTGNPVLLRTTGYWSSTGCADMFRGPDLKTIVSAYHVRNGVYRKLCIDRMIWNAQGNLVVDGPKIDVVQGGHMLADYSDYMNRATIGSDYVNVWGGNWGMFEPGWLMWGDSRGQGGLKKELCNINTGPNYVVEVTTKLMNKGTLVPYPKYGVVVSDNGNPTSDTGFYVFIDDTSKVLATISRLNGVWGTWQNASLPNWNMANYHNLRIRKNGDTFEIYFDGMRKMTRTVAGLGAGKVGFVTDDCHADFGWMTWANW